MSSNEVEEIGEFKTDVIDVDVVWQKMIFKLFFTVPLKYKNITFYISMCCSYRAVVITVQSK